MRLDAANTAVVLDSSACLPEPQTRSPNWRVVPAYVTLAGSSLRDWIDISASELYGALRDGVAPTTSQPSPADFAAVFDGLAGFDRILAVLVSERLSGTVGSALVGATERVVVIDSGTIMGTQVLLADAIQRRLELGTDVEELLGLANRFRRAARCVYMLQTLEYLARGGRIGRVAKFTGQLLSIRPLIDLRGGENIPLARAHGRRRALDALERVVERDAPTGSDLHAGVVHGDCLDDAERLADSFRELRPEASIDLICSFSPSLCVHTGPGALGVFWFSDSPAP
jgi:DegV family protein with EDD domain